MNFIINKEQYLALKAAWIQEKYQHDHNSVSHVIYNILRGFPADRGFTPITDPKKLANGASPLQAFDEAKYLANRNMMELMFLDHDSQDRKDYKVKAFNDRMAGLKDIYGIDFTPEIRAAIREALK